MALAPLPSAKPAVPVTPTHALRFREVRSGPFMDRGMVVDRVTVLEGRMWSEEFSQALREAFIKLPPVHRG